MRARDESLRLIAFCRLKVKVTYGKTQIQPARQYLPCRLTPSHFSQMGLASLFLWAIVYVSDFLIGFPHRRAQNTVAVANPQTKGLVERAGQEKAFASGFQLFRLPSVKCRLNCQDKWCKTRPVLWLLCVGVFSFFGHSSWVKTVGEKLQPRVKPCRLLGIQRQSAFPVLLR